MNALALAIAPVALERPEQSCRTFQIEGDYMEPSLRGGDFLIVAPCQRYLYEAVYLIDAGHGERPVLAQLMNGRVRLSGYNKFYPAQYISADQFNEGVKGISVAEVHVQDRRFFRRAA